MKEGVTLMIDSGVGGLSVLAMARRRLPEENFCFFADAAFAPYGDKSPEEIRKRLHAIIAEYSGKKLKALLLACNTATSAAAALLREELTMPVLGVEPALKPAVFNSEGQIIVMATRLTIRETKFRNLLSLYEKDRDIVPLACPGLMELVEKDPESPETEAYLRTALAPWKDSARSIVLGCTHYVFLRPLFERCFPHLQLFDGNDGVTRHLSHILENEGILGGEGRTEIDCSLSDPDAKGRYLEKSWRMLAFCDRIYRK